MRTPLLKFSKFVSELLPHEVKYLSSIEDFQSKERKKILDTVYYNVIHSDTLMDYDLCIDKRKYNHVKSWIERRLSQIDVDKQYEYFLHCEKQITSDLISPAEEKKLLRLFAKYKHPSFYFSKFYEIALIYRRYLLFRMRHNDLHLINQFLEKYKNEYQHSQSVTQELDVAASDIIDQYTKKKRVNKAWLGRLQELYLNKKLESQLRLRSFILATFICYSIDDYLELKIFLDELDKELQAGSNYSKRILLNYYNVRLMYHTHYKDWDDAINYGTLAVKYHNEDSILYVNNLCAVYLKTFKYKEALSLMEIAYPHAKNTNNFHNRISFIAFYIKTLMHNDRLEKSIKLGSIFLDAYEKEILKFRWFLFFSFYFESLLASKKYHVIEHNVLKYKLLKRFNEYNATGRALPIIPIIYNYSIYKLSKLSYDEYLSRVEQYLTSKQLDFKSKKTTKSILKELSSRLPDLEIVYQITKE